MMAYGLNSDLKRGASLAGRAFCFNGAHAKVVSLGVAQANDALEKCAALKMAFTTVFYYPIE